MLVQILGGLVGGLSVIVVALIFALVNRPPARPRRVVVTHDYPRTYSKWKIPPSGRNLEQWKRTKKLLDEIETECRDAEKESVKLQAELAQARADLEDVRADRDDLEHRLDIATTALRAFTHPGMQIRVGKARTVSLTPTRETQVA